MLAKLGNYDLRFKKFASGLLAQKLDKKLMKKYFCELSYKKLSENFETMFLRTNLWPETLKKIPCVQFALPMYSCQRMIQKYTAKCFRAVRIISASFNVTGVHFAVIFILRVPLLKCSTNQ